MSKKLGGKYKAPAAPSTPVQTDSVPPQVISTPTSQPSSPSTPVRTAQFAPQVHSTPIAQASSSTTASGSGETVTKLLRKQSLTRQQLNNVLQKRIDKIINLSKKKTEKEKEIEKDTTSKVIEEENEEENESTVVRDGRYLKSNNGFFRTLQDRDDSVDEELAAEESRIELNDAETVDAVEKENIDADFAVKTKKTTSKKRKSSKEVREAKPKPKKRSKARNHQNFRDRYLTVKKRVDVLQPDHGLEQDFFYVVKNNMQDPDVKGAASTAGKWMVYAKGELLDKFMNEGIKYNKKTMVMMANAADFKQYKPKLLGNEDDDETVDKSDDSGEESEEEEEPVVQVSKKRKKSQRRDDSPEPDLYNLGGTAIPVRTPGS